jgi:hypothetical protein
MKYQYLFFLLFKSLLPYLFAKKQPHENNNADLKRSPFIAASNQGALKKSVFSVNTLRKFNVLRLIEALPAPN